MHLTITFWGIVTLVCQPATTPCNNPSALAVYLPNGAARPTVCPHNGASGVKVAQHAAYIRTRTAVLDGGKWPGAERCEDGANCWLWPLEGDNLHIDGVTDAQGKGVTVMAGAAHDRVTWRNLVKDFTMTTQPESLSAAYMKITTGELRFEPRCNGMITSTLSVREGKGNIVILGSAGKQLILPDHSDIDIMNLPPMVAVDHPGSALDPHDSGNDFFLHYRLAKLPANGVCNGPTARQKIKAKAKVVPWTAYDECPTNLSIGCSNSIYP